MYPLLIQLPFLPFLPFFHLQNYFKTLHHCPPQLSKKIPVLCDWIYLFFLKDNISKSKRDYFVILLGVVFYF